MAPRRRPLKKGNRRMDAALDAMTPLGFNKKLVHQTVKKLLKVYDGNEGWHFIEDGAYYLLIDQLLQTQQDQASKFEKYKAASNYYSTTYTVDELMQNSKSTKDSCSPLNWDLDTKQFVDALADAIKKDLAQKAKKKEGPSPIAKK